MQIKYIKKITSFLLVFCIVAGLSLAYITPVHAEDTPKKTETEEETKAFVTLTFKNADGKVLKDGTGNGQGGQAIFFQSVDGLVNGNAITGEDPIGGTGGLGFAFDKLKSLVDLLTPGLIFDSTIKSNEDLIGFTIFMMNDVYKDCAYATWECDGSVFTFSNKATYGTDTKLQTKDDVVYVGGIHLAKEGCNEYSDMGKKAQNDPDFYDVPTLAGLQLTAKIHSVVSSMMNSLVNWVARKLGTSFDGVVFTMATDFGPSTDYMDSLLGTNENGVSYMTEFVSIFKAIGWALTMLIFIFILFFSFTGMITGFEESLFGLVGRLFMAAFMVVFSTNIVQIFFDIANGFGSVITTSSEALNVTLVSDLLGSGHMSVIIQIILVCMVLLELFKLFLQVIERYLVMMLLYFMSPVAFATFTSKSTSQIFASFCKMLISQMGVFIINLWCMKVIVLVIARGPDRLTTAPNVMHEMIYFFVLIGLIKIALKIDDYMKDMGMTVARTGGNSLAGAAIGMLQSARMGASMVGKGTRTAQRAFGAATRASGGGNGGRSGGGSYGKAGPTITAASILGNRSFGSTDKKGTTIGGAALNEALNQNKSMSKALGLDNGTTTLAKKQSSYNGQTGEGKLALKNKDGSISHMDISSTPKEGYKELGNGMYGKADANSVPIGGLRVLGEDEQVMGRPTLDKVAERTGNLTEPQLNTLGLSNLDMKSATLETSMDGKRGRIHSGEETVAVIRSGEAPHGHSVVDTENGNTFTSYIKPDEAVVTSFFADYNNCEPSAETNDMWNAKADFGKLIFDNDTKDNETLVKNFYTNGYINAQTELDGKVQILNPMVFDIEEGDVPIRMNNKETGNESTLFVRPISLGGKPKGRIKF